ncbi:MAG: hypothetical protein IJ134_02150 [Bacilli bacterium]|nr:hypothetical protein [Bacilli bacterium]
MKKLIYPIIFISFFIFTNVSAEEITGYTSNNDSIFTSGPNIEIQGCLNKVNGSFNRNYASPGKLHCLDSGDEVKILNYDSIIASTVSSCKGGYYKANYTASNRTVYTGYICADNVSVNINTDKYKDELKDFPASYLEKLTILKEKHPNWKFSAYYTNIDFYDAVDHESYVGKSFIQVNDPNGSDAKYLSLDGGSYDASSKKYILKEGPNWYAANSKTVAYYMDPRNFLDEIRIFMFENLGYNGSYQTKEVLDKILSGTGLSSYKDYFMEAATYDGNSVSPISLAARSRQEVALSNGTLSNSANGQTYNGRAVYNFFNIGANSGCENPITCGLAYAYNKGWFDPRTAILGGAKIIASSYINSGQNTFYFQKFNVTNNVYGNYAHQYMTNIMAPISESTSTHKAYSSISNLFDSPFEFVIPVYNNMPISTSLPTSVDDTARAEIETVSNKTNSLDVNTIINSSGYRYNGEYISKVQIGTSVKDFVSNIRNVSGSANVTIKNKNESDAIATNDEITIQNNNESKTFKVIIYGDANGDSKVNVLDLLKTQNKILNKTNISGTYLMAIDVNKDSKVDVLDLLKIQKEILGTSKIEQ